MNHTSIPFTKSYKYSADREILSFMSPEFINRISKNLTLFLICLAAIKLVNGIVFILFKKINAVQHLQTHLRSLYTQSVCLSVCYYGVLCSYWIEFVHFSVTVRGVWTALCSYPSDFSFVFDNLYPYDALNKRRRALVLVSFPRIMCLFRFLCPIHSVNTTLYSFCRHSWGVDPRVFIILYENSHKGC